MLERRYAISIAAIFAIVALYIALQMGDDFNKNNDVLIITQSLRPTEESNLHISEEVTNALSESLLNEQEAGEHVALKVRPMPDNTRIEWTTLHNDFLAALERSAIEHDGRAEISLYKYSQVCREVSPNKEYLQKFLLENEESNLKAGYSNQEIQDSSKAYEDAFLQCEGVRSAEPYQSPDKYLEAAIDKGSDLAKTYFAVNYARFAIDNQDESKGQPIKDKATTYFDAAYRACDIYSIFVLTTPKYFGAGLYFETPREIPNDNLELSNLFLLEKIYESTEGISKEKQLIVRNQIEEALSAQSMSQYSADRSKEIAKHMFEKNCKG